ncbi:MAG: YegP family protein [Anaerolineaceae bacterium]|nr:YegP family protein [Anaerolineaceae bacterium]
MQNPKFKIFSGKDGQFYFKLTARNGEPILASEGYTSKSGCKNGIASVKKNSVKDEQYKLLTASNGQFYFNLIAGNNQVIGKSETYKTKQGRANGMKAVKSAAPKAPIEDAS